MTAQAELLDAPRASEAGVEQRPRAIDGNRLRTALRPALAPLGIVAAVGVISLLHYGTSVHLTLLHEIFKRLYYVPIVIAAVAYGVKGGVATAMLASLLYLPHIVIDWQGWPVFAVEQYGELILFNVVALLTGFLADRLRAERNRYREAAAELQEAYCHLKARTDERLRIDRLVTVGRIASGIAHEIRGPLGGLLGCIEVLESEFPRSHAKWEFFAIARKEMRRLDTVVREFLEFAEPAPPTSRAIDLNDVAHSASRLARPSLAVRAVTLRVQPSAAALLATADAEQVQRAVLNLILAGTSDLRDTRVDVKVLQTAYAPVIIIDIHGMEKAFPAAEVFDPFPRSGRGNGLAFATARRLVENQHGSLRAERVDEALQFLIELPAASEVAPH